MPSNSDHVPLSARENISSSTHAPPEDHCIYPLSSTTSSWDSKPAALPCIFRPPKPKVDVASTDVCIYPLSPTEVHTLDLFEGKHAPQCREFDYEPLMVTISNIFEYSETRIQVQDNKCISENTLVPPEDILDIINQISFDSKSDVDLSETSIQILNVVMEYKWEAKMVLILAAFVTSYGAFCFEKTTVNPMGRRRASYPNRELLSSNLMRISNLVKNLLEVCTIMIQFRKDNDQKVMEDVEAKHTKLLHTVIYQIIKVGVACSSYMELVISDIKNLTSATDTERQEDLLKELVENNKNVTEVMATIDREAAQNFTPTEYLDVRQFLTRIFIEEKTFSGLPIQMDFKELEGKLTAFLVSNVDIKIENFTTLVQTYKKIHEEKKFRIVWIPIVDQTMEWTDAQEMSFSEVASSMPWYCCHPSAVTKAFSSHIVETWQYQKESSLVVLNEQTKVIATDALSVVNTWSHLAFPFSSDMETIISKRWSIRRMIEEWEIDDLDVENDIVCIYGGHNLEMMKSLSNFVESINYKRVRAIYVGTKAPKEKLQNIVNSLEQMEVKSLSTAQMSSFWSQLAIITKSKFVKDDAPTLEKDAVMEQLTTLLGHSKKEIWTTMIHKDSTEIIKYTGAQLLECFKEFNSSNREFQTASELWECLIKISDSYTTLGATALASYRIRDLFRSEYADVSDLLAKLFVKEDAIFKGQIGKPVCFVITSMDIIKEESTTLADIHKQIPKDIDLKILWIPIGDTSVELQGTEVEKSFEKAASALSWYYCQSSMLTSDFLAYIRQEWYSHTRCTLVILDKQGSLVSTLPMVEKWGASAFPQALKTPLKSCELSARSFSYNFIDDTSGPTYGRWTSMEYESSMVTVAELMYYSPVDIRGKFNTANLSEKTYYEIFFILKMKPDTRGWEDPVRLSMKFSNGSDTGIKVRQENIFGRPKETWFALKVGEFCTPTSDDEELYGELTLIQTASKGNIHGLFLKGAVIQPKI